MVVMTTAAFEQIAKLTNKTEKELEEFLNESNTCLVSDTEIGDIETMMEVKESFKRTGTFFIS